MNEALQLHVLFQELLADFIQSYQQRRRRTKWKGVLFKFRYPILVLPNKKKKKKPALSELNNLNSVFYLPSLSGVWFTLRLHVWLSSRCCITKLRSVDEQTCARVFLPFGRGSHKTSYRATRMAITVRSFASPPVRGSHWALVFLRGKKRLTEIIFPCFANCD